MFGLGGLVRESVDLVAHEMEGASIFGVESLVRDIGMKKAWRPCSWFQV